MSQYQVKLSQAALDELRASRSQVLEQLGNAKIGARLASLDAQSAGELANALLNLLDAVDRVASRAKPV